MNGIALSGTRLVHKFSYGLSFARHLTHRKFACDISDDGYQYIEQCLNGSWERSDYNYERRAQEPLSDRQRFFANAKKDAARVLEILRQDGPGFDAKKALDDLPIRVSGLLVREVLLGILTKMNNENKTRCAKLGYKFFLWSARQGSYKHTVNAYHLILTIFSSCGELKAICRLIDEMIKNGFPTTARTFNILICTIGEAGFAKKIVEDFVKSKTFNYRPFKHSYSAILHSLLVLHQYKLIEWVHEQMLADGYSSDVSTYNVLLWAKYRLGKLDQFHKLLEEMGRSGLSPDFHTYNILLHVLGKGDKPLAALNLLNHMKEAGPPPTVLHFTSLIDGLSRAGNLDACKYFFDEITKNGCKPDVVCYTVMITGYIAADQLENAQAMLDEMITKGQLPNVFTYSSMIRGFCIAGKFKEACSMLNAMESRGCSPNFLVYSTLVRNLQKAGKHSEADMVITRMVEKGQYVHLVSEMRRYRRW
ncbi:hypothetical protein K2173_027404 [Erythroxylum novogranatense]|uniref:Pentatricopeptide repeat-containing protein n=1 Tax=Erythroxylum novogranatense TaxID=1862640 RepID=A0AAV8TYZ2_9ROSI|nr:hypothetical protein K2173_027404 [Erythroxylum novogranatense]